MAVPAARRATPEDLETIPEHHVGQIVDGVLHVQSFGAPAHARARTRLGLALERFDRDPAGWVLLPGIELRLRGDVLVPDLAGWRRERMPELPSVAHATLAPDWVAEVLSPRTASFDRVEKMAVYAREGVAHVWIVDADEQLVEVFALDGETYRRAAAAHGDASVRLVPFDAIELALGSLWQR